MGEARQKVKKQHSHLRSSAGVLRWRLSRRIRSHADQLLSERDHASAELRGRERCARRAEAICRASTTVAGRYVANGDRDGLLLADEDHEPLAAGDAGVEEVSLQHGIVPGHDRDHHGGVLRAWLLW